jgi:hypothetical protein
MSSHIPINIVFEDDLSGVVIRKILQGRGGYEVGRCFLGRGFGNIKKKIDGFNKAAKGMPYLVLTDLDKEECAPTLIQDWMKNVPLHQNLLFRVAVREVESWVLADRDNFAEFLGVEKVLIPVDVDEIGDPKDHLVNLVRKSSKRKLRDDIVPKKGSTARQGPNYNGPLISFVKKFWNPDEAMHNSPSLRRTIKAIKHFQPKWED